MNRENFVGGENTKLGAYPFMALLGIYEFNKELWAFRNTYAIFKFIKQKEFGQCLDFVITGFNRTDGTLRQRRRNPYNYICGGTVINKHYILTAAHCMNKEYPRYTFNIILDIRL